MLLNYDWRVLLGLSSLHARSVYSKFNYSLDQSHLSKRDPSWVPADLSSEGCVLLKKDYAASKSNKGIQMAECYLNARIENQRFVVFVPDHGNMLDPLEWGPYGTCTAYSEWPTSDMLGSFENVNYACFGWTNKGPDSANRPIPTFPGTSMIPPPIGCPSTLIGCYAKGAYDPGGKLPQLASVTSNFSGLLWGPKDANKQPMWCRACPMGTNLQMQLENAAQMQCDASKRATYKYPGSVALMNPYTATQLAQGGIQASPSTAPATGTSSGGENGQSSFLGSILGGSKNKMSAAPVTLSAVNDAAPFSSQIAIVQPSTEKIGTSLLGSLLGGGGAKGGKNPASPVVTDPNTIPQAVITPNVASSKTTSSNTVPPVTAPPMPPIIIDKQPSNKEETKSNKSLLGSLFGIRSRNSINSEASPNQALWASHASAKSSTKSVETNRRRRYCRLERRRLHRYRAFRKNI